MVTVADARALNALMAFENCNLEVCALLVRTVNCNHSKPLGNDCDVASMLEC